MRTGGEIIAPKRIQQILTRGEGQLGIELPFFLLEGILGEGVAQFVEHTRPRVLQRDLRERRQRAVEIALDHDTPLRNFRFDLPQQVAPIGQARIGDSPHDHPLVLRRHGEEAVDELLCLGRIRADRAGDEAEINARALGLLESLGMKENAYGRRHVRIVRLAAITIDPLLYHAK